MKHELAVNKYPVGQSLDKTFESIWTTKRLCIAILLFSASVINYLDRVSMSIAAPVIAKELGWGPGTMGIILASVFWTYAAALVPMGWLTDKFGPRKLNALSVFFWSGAAVFSGIVSRFTMMLSSRLALGLAEAPTLPAGLKVVRQWFPLQERGLVTAIARSGAEAGPALGMPLVAFLIVKFNWRISFAITGALGFIWVALWLKYFRDDPQDSLLLSQGEREYLAANTASKQKSDVMPISKRAVWQLLQHPTMWGLALSEGCIMYTAYLILTWLPSYLIRTKDMKLLGASLLISAAFGAAWVLGIAVCKLSDIILTPDEVLKGRRRTLVIIFMLLSSVFTLITWVGNPFAIFLIITMANISLSSTIGLNMTLVNDLVASPAYAATAVAILLLGGNFFGSLAPVVTGFVVKDTGGFGAAFFLAGALTIVGALLSFFMTRTPIALS